MCIPLYLVITLLRLDRGINRVIQGVSSGDIPFIKGGAKTVVDDEDILMGYENALVSERTYLEKIWEEMSTAPAQLTLLMEIAKGSNKLLWVSA